MYACVCSAAWKGIQRAHTKGLARAIGVSNFKIADLDAVMAVGGTPPAVNQVLAQHCCRPASATTKWKAHLAEHTVEKDK